MVPQSTILARIARQRLLVALAYRGDLIASAVSNVLIVSTGLFFLVQLMRQVPLLGAWTRSQMIFCWGFAECVVGLVYVIFGGLFVANHRYVLGGELDRLLVRPADPMGQLLAENLGIDDLSVVVVGGLVMAFSAAGLPPVELWKWLLLPLMLLSGAFVVGGLLMAFVSIGLRLHHRGTAVGLVTQFAIFNRYPIDIFARPLRWLITFGLPLAFGGFYPAALYLGRSEWFAYSLATPLVALAAMAFGYGAWRGGLSRWASTGS